MCSAVHPLSCQLAMAASEVYANPFAIKHTPTSPLVSQLNGRGTTAAAVPGGIPQADTSAFPNEVLLKILETANTPVAVAAAVNRALQQSVMVHDPRRLSLTIDPASPSQMGAGIGGLGWLSRTKDGTSQRTGPLRLALKHGSDSQDDAKEAPQPSVAVVTSAVRVLLHTPLRVVTHLELAFPNELSQADVDVLGARMPLLRSFELQNNTSLTSLSLNAMPNLHAAYIIKCCNLAELNVSGCTRLLDIECKHSKLKALDVSSCTQLHRMACSDNPDLASLGDLAVNTALEEVEVCGCKALTSLDLTFAVQLRTLYLPGAGASMRSLTLPPNACLEELCNATTDLLGTGHAYGRIASLKDLHLVSCDVDINVIIAIPGLLILELTTCKLPEQWVLAALPTLRSLKVTGCSNLTALDASPATALTSLKLESMSSLKRVEVPPCLRELTCEALKALVDVDVSPAVDVHATIRRCPAYNTRLRTATLTIEP